MTSNSPNFGHQNNDYTSPKFHQNIVNISQKFTPKNCSYFTKIPPTCFIFQVPTHTSSPCFTRAESWASLPFYPDWQTQEVNIDFVLIYPNLSWFILIYPDLSWFYPDFILILSWLANSRGEHRFYTKL